LYDPLGVFCRRHPAFYIFADNEEELEEWIRALNLKVADSPMKNLRVEEPVIDIHPIERQGWLTKRGGIVKVPAHRRHTHTHHRAHTRRVPYVFVLR
jgi:hypothetical protein